MPRIHLNFANRRPAAGLGPWLLLLLGATVAAGTVLGDYGLYRPRLAAAEQRVQAAQKAVQARQPATLKIGDGQLAAEWKRAIEIAHELNLPWEKLFASFEAETGRQVGILTLEPDVTKGELALTAEARNFAEMLAYYRMLQSREHLSGVVLHTHQVNQQDREKPIRFRITAKWGASS